MPILSRKEEFLTETVHVIFHELKLGDKGTLTLILLKFTDCGIVELNKLTQNRHPV